jgi:hypothetical protein
VTTPNTVYWLARKADIEYNSTSGLFTKRGEPVGTINKAGYIVLRISGQNYYGCWPEKEIDHINGNPADNRMVNLRNADSSQNKANRRLNRDVKMKGVRKHYRKFYSTITVGGKQIYLGMHDTAENAHEAYAAAARHHFGEFAVLSD